MYCNLKVFLTFSILNIKTIYLFFFSFLFTAMKEYKPTDATTNPSLILAASKLDNYQHLIDKAVNYGKSHGK